MSLADLRQVAESLAALVLELPQRDLGGHLPDWTELVELVDWARSTGAAAHLDGAGLWEAQPFYDRLHAQIAGLFRPDWRTYRGTRRTGGFGRAPMERRGQQCTLTKAVLSAPAAARRFHTDLLRPPGTVASSCRNRTGIGSITMSSTSTPISVRWCTPAR